MEEEESEEEIEARLKKRKRSLVRAAIAVLIAVVSVSGYLYTRYGVKKSDLGGPCTFAMHCKKEAPTCLRLSVDDEGACSRACDPGTDCAPGIRCVKVGTEEYDDRGVPLEGGYCIPQALLDARKKKAQPDAGPDAGKLDSWLAVPEIDGQLEAEIALQAGTSEPRTFVVKGTLVRAKDGSSKRRIADASTLRLFSVDDDKKTFGVIAMGGVPGDVKVEKTGQSDRVADHACDVWRLVEARATREVCVVQGGAFVDPSAHIAPPWIRELAVRAAFPLRVVERDAKGNETSRTVATHFEAHPVAASLFAIPHTYRNLAGN